MVGLLESVCVAYWPPGQGNVVTVPAPWHLQDNRRPRGELLARIFQAGVLGRRPSARGRQHSLLAKGCRIAMAAGLLLAGQFRLGEVVDVDAVKGSEHYAVNVVAAVL